MTPRHKETERQDIQKNTRQALLDAAAQEFAHRGYEAANINKISRAAGFAKGTVYNYFASKRALMLALIDLVAAEHYEYMAAVVRQTEDPRQRVESFFQSGFEYVRQYYAPARAIFNIIYGHDTELKEYLYAAYQPMFELMIVDILTPGIAHGDFRPLDPQTTGVLVMTLYLGTGSSIDEQGRHWIDPQQVADFTLHALIR